MVLSMYKENGVIFQRKSNRLYQGVDGDNWYLNSLFPEIFKSFFEEHIDLSCWEENFVDVCNNPQYISDYIRVSKDKLIDYRIVLCCTEKDLPEILSVQWKEKKFIGYDYAYPGGDYYSAVFNELHFNRYKEYENIELNEFGLLGNEQELNKYLSIRKKLEDSGCDLEKGDFLIYKLFEVR